MATSKAILVSVQYFVLVKKTCNLFCKNFLSFQFPPYSFNLILFKQNPEFMVRPWFRGHGLSVGGVYAVS